MELKAEEIIKLHVQCEEAYAVKHDGAGYLNVIPIVSGAFDGKIRGEVINGGADWNTRRDNGSSHVFAKYLLRAENGDYIAIENEGKIGKADWERTIKTIPRFQVSQDSPYSWLNTGVYVGALEGGTTPNSVEITIYKLL